MTQLTETLLKNSTDQEQLAVQRKSQEYLRKLQSKQCPVPVETALCLALYSLQMRCDYGELARLGGHKADILKKHVVSFAKRFGVVSNAASMTAEQLCVTFGVPGGCLQLVHKLSRIIGSSSLLLDTQKDAAGTADLVIMCSFWLIIKAFNLKNCRKDRLIGQSLLTLQQFDTALERVQTVEEVVDFLKLVKEGGRELLAASAAGNSAKKRSRTANNNNDDDENDESDNDDESRNAQPIDGIVSMLQRQEWHQTERYQNFCKWRFQLLADEDATMKRHLQNIDKQFHKKVVEC